MNVVLITMDTVRGDRLGAYGYRLPTSPNLDAFTDGNAVRFSSAETVSTFTAPSHGAILTGLHPAGHGALTNGFKLLRESRTLAEVLGDVGYRTGGFVAAPWILGRRFGFDQGFEVYEEGERIFRGADAINRDALAFIEKVQEERFFLWLHYYDVHCPYVSPRPYGRMFAKDYRGNLEPYGRCGKTADNQMAAYNEMKLSEEDVVFINGLYDGGIRYLDTELGKLFARIEKWGLMDETLFVITADHGEALSDRSSFGHNLSLHEWETRVPLWFRIPAWGGSAADAAVSEVVSTVDIVPTVLELLGLPVPPDLDGRSLYSLLMGSEQKGRVEVPVFSRTAEERGVPDRAMIRLGQFKLQLAVETGKAELFDLASDPGETTDVARRHSEVSAELEARLLAWLSTQSDRLENAEPQQVEDRVREKLKALGYINP